MEKRGNKENEKWREEDNNGDGVTIVHVISKYACPSRVLPKLQDPRCPPQKCLHPVCTTMCKSPYHTTPQSAPSRMVGGGYETVCICGRVCLPSGILKEYLDFVEHFQGETAGGEGRIPGKKT